MVALPASDGIHKWWVPVDFVHAEKLAKSKTEMPQSNTAGMKPQWKALKAAWLKTTFTGTEGCSQKEVQDTIWPIVKDLLKKAGRAVPARKHALLQLSQDASNGGDEEPVG